MSAEPAPRAAQDRWRDANGTPISLFCWVEQIAEHLEHGELFSRLHKRGEVIGRGPDVLYLRFEGEGGVISLSPQLVRLLANEPGERCEWGTWRRATDRRNRA
jgi:hypothetical protein